MDRNTPQVLRFGRFALDLARGCLRDSDQDIDLRPKTYEVLRCLVDNAGRLVSKQALYDTVWPNATVTDDSLVQCIRELRVKLGDDTHRLIKTVPRRGYLLDPMVAVPAPSARDLDLPRPTLHLGRARKWALGGAVATGMLSAAVGVTYSSGLFAHSEQKPADPMPIAHATAPDAPASDLFTQMDAIRVAGIADSKQLPLPDFRIGTPSDAVREPARHFVGIWVSDKGWSVSNRQLMLIVTDIDANGIATGYVVHGPPQPSSHIQSAPNFSRFQARIADGLLSYSDTTGDHSAAFTNRNQIMFRTLFRDGTPGSVLLEPVWTLATAEHPVDSIERHR
jgi:DNA-binding winged helix-turn-helix (wHTH) protein